MPKSYPSDMRDQEWEIIRSLIAAAKKGGRPRSVNIRTYWMPSSTSHEEESNGQCFPKIFHWWEQCTGIFPSGNGMERLKKSMISLESVLKVCFLLGI
ncbi:MAG: hypothetical protein A3D39_00475 [Candidatus Buchananbacteria bacterium RIFCSPHIGHO2_02_FULL_39_17]|uniref:Transposase n=1 Tax=Candidatus Buchananbacteria bacterium RIFCSPLOWO2_01_FULL_40_23b TaxID=1797544 RepID=A0A1G1YTB6_9BACT|nr:MAG: hypothetical protein A3D39_00475 [Candidatus Buchananbacteria bacterium RIFCSPHIGHO2_02_FULL_39_17]OGY55588.1 MAG: hypothetical protein A2912_01585 [Candidatus Buchananbacteria bacterium RIFCSPLOWO2_01_FULL_40_23b]